MQVEQLTSTIPNPATADFSHQHKKKHPLLNDFRGEILIVIEPDGISDVFCRDQGSGLAMLRRGALWCGKICKLKNAKFYTGVMTPTGGRFHSISRRQAIERVREWILRKT